MSYLHVLRASIARASQYINIHNTLRSPCDPTAGSEHAGARGENYVPSAVMFDIRQYNLISHDISRGLGGRRTRGQATIIIGVRPGAALVEHII